MFNIMRGITLAVPSKYSMEKDNIVGSSLIFLRVKGG